MHGVTKSRTRLQRLTLQSHTALTRGNALLHRFSIKRGDPRPPAAPHGLHVNLQGQTAARSHQEPSRGLRQSLSSVTQH